MDIVKILSFCILYVVASFSAEGQSRYKELGDTKSSVSLPILLEHALQDNTLSSLLGTKGTQSAFLKGDYIGGKNIEQTVGVILRVSELENALSYMESKGIVAEKVSDSILVADVTIEGLRVLTLCPYVKGIQQSRQFHPFLKNARTAVNAAYVHQGEQLDTPYDGTGVLIGVIDRGIQYKHIAFYDGSIDKPRAVRVWNHTINGAMPSEEPYTKDDNIGDTQGHGTHVANIAAGSDVGNDLYGMAPKADLFLCSSLLSEKNVLREVAFMRNYAKQHNQPLIINMSFGQQIGPHDGTGYYNQYISKLIEESSLDDVPRFYVCAANGNERGQKIHTQGSFTKSVNKISVAMRYSHPMMGSVVVGDIWCNKADDKSHLSFTAYASDLKGKRQALTSEQLERLYVGEWIDKDVSHKQVYSFQLGASSLAEVLQLPLDSMVYLELEISGQPGDGFHGWCAAYNGSFEKGIYSENLKVDDRFLVGEGASCIPKAFSVTAYNAYKPGMPIAEFSSAGPWLGEEKKPTVAAPGVNVMSAVSEYGMQNVLFVNTDKVASDMFGRMRWYYYQPMDGTSMATPVVTGVMALWLQANPKLTYHQMLDILRQTSVHNKYNSAEWDPNFGYGRIDAYEGIKHAILLRRINGIENEINSSSPLTIKKSMGEWKVLFNSDERFAEIRLLNMQGYVLRKHLLSAVKAGEEHIIDLHYLPKGMYVIQVSTANSICAKKLVVS